MTQKIRLPINWMILVLIVFYFILGFVLYPYLPENIPSHWNIAGEVDRYASKLFHVTFIPSLTLGIYLFMSLAPLMDPKPENYKKFIGVFEKFRVFIVLFLGILHTSTLLFAMGYPVSVTKVLRVVLGAMLIFMGNYFGKVRHNFTFGIKNPWTLASEEVWNKTHRASGPLWIMAGIVWILSIFLADRIAFWVSMGALIVVSSYGMVYSYIVFRRIKG